MINYLNTYRRYACDISRINEEVQRNPQDLIQTTEKVFLRDLRQIAEKILSVSLRTHIVLLSGPSGSGKTTTAKKLSDEFQRMGANVQLISMDDFYLGKDKVRILPDGKPDFESVEALDIPLIQKCIQQLSTEGECIIPKYDFKNSCRTSQTEHIRLTGSSVIIMEGIHALNPIFSEGMSKEQVLKVYVAVKQGIKDNEDYVLTNRQIRLLRRLIRDSKFRKVDPSYMLSMWNSVVEGEMKYIRPYRYSSDFTVNSIHIYEPCVMKNYIIDLLSRVQESDPNRELANQLIRSLERFREIDPSLVPENSLIREFIGGGSYSY